MAGEACAGWQGSACAGLQGDGGVVSQVHSVLDNALEASTPASGYKTV